MLKLAAKLFRPARAAESYVLETSKWLIGSDSDCGGTSTCYVGEALAPVADTSRTSNSLGNSTLKEISSRDAAETPKLDYIDRNHGRAAINPRDSNDPIESTGSSNSLNANSSTVGQGKKHIVFWGSLVGSHSYGGIRQPTASRPIDLSAFNCVRLTCRCSTSEPTPRTYMMNIRTATVFPTWIYQHPFTISPGAREWHEIDLRVRDFTLTSHGRTQRQIEVDMSVFKSLGVSILHQPGAFSLDISKIEMVNVRD